MTRYSWILFGMLLMPLPASANDSTARKAAGGMELVKNDNIQMVSEVLEISTSKVTVTYHFLNTSDNDIKTTVAFPMPIIEWSDSDSNQKPLDSFRVIVDGTLVPIRKDRQLLVGGINVADKLRKSGMSDDQIFDPIFSCMEWSIYTAHFKGCKITEKQNKVIQSLLKGPDGDVTGWKIKDTAYWEQTYPARREVVVVHEYKPLVGLIYDHATAKQSKEACLDQGAERRLINKRPEDSTTLAIRDVEYILGTGRNWKGPIKNFKLILKKRHQSDMVSLCFPGKPIKTSPTTLEFEQTDYVPQDRLILLFYDFYYDPEHPD